MSFEFFISLPSTAPSADCPICSQQSVRVHSRYQRSLNDLPCSGQQSQIELESRRFFCDNAACPRKIFAERLPDTTGFYQKGLAIREQLAQQDSGNAEWQTDLVLSHYKLSESYQELGDMEKATAHLWESYFVLIGMEAAGMYLDPQLTSLLALLEESFRGEE